MKIMDKEFELPVMKISEVISDLKDLQNELGDLNVYFINKETNDYEEVSAVVSYNLEEGGDHNLACILVPNDNLLRIIDVK